MNRKDVVINDMQVTLYVGVTCEDICKVVSDFFVCGCRGRELNKVYHLSRNEPYVFVNEERNRALVIL